MAVMALDCYLFFDLPSRVTDDMPRMLMGWKCK